MAFPNVPKLLGVPQVPRDPNEIYATIILLVEDALTVARLFGNSSIKWGVFDKHGTVALSYESIVSVEYVQDWAVANYPVEKGAFENYDKVNTPVSIRVRFAAGKSLESRKALLDSLDKLGHTLDLVDIYTPETIYRNFSVSSYSYDRKADRGVGLLLVDAVFVEIQQVVVETFSNTQDPSGQDPSNGGVVQGQSTTLPVPTVI